MATIDLATQKNHYIPKLYLKQWQGDDERLCEFTRPYNKVKPRRTHRDGTGYVEGLYAFELLPPAMATLLENSFLRKADTLADLTLQRLLKGELELSPEQRSAWSRFIMTMMHRNPEGLERTKRRIIEESSRLLNEVEAELPDHRRTEETLTVIRRMQAGFTDEELQDLVLKAVRHLMDSEYVGSHLNKMKITVINFDHSYYPLMTSDRPIVMTNGLTRPDSHLVMPISPRRAFAAANTNAVLKQLHEEAHTFGLAQRINHRVVRQARKYAYAIDDKELEFVEGRLGDCIPWSPFE